MKPICVDLPAAWFAAAVAGLPRTDDDRMGGVFNGVLVTCEAGWIDLVGCNGRVLFRSSWFASEKLENFSVIIPAETCRQAVKCKTGEPVQLMHTESGCWFLTTATLDQAFIPLRGTYPPWWTMLPPVPKPEQIPEWFSVTLSCDDLERICKMSRRSLHQKVPCVVLAGPDPEKNLAVINGGGQMIGVIRPAARDNDFLQHALCSK